MKLTDGPTKSEKPIEFTDWKRVEAFGLRISKHFLNSKNSNS